MLKIAYIHILVIQCFAYNNCTTPLLILSFKQNKNAVYIKCINITYSRLDFDIVRFWNRGVLTKFVGITIVLLKHANNKINNGVRILGIACIDFFCQTNEVNWCILDIKSSLALDFTSSNNYNMIVATMFYIGCILNCNCHPKYYKL